MENTQRLADLERRFADLEREVILLRERCAVLEQRTTAQSSLIVENTRITQSTSDSVNTLAKSSAESLSTLRADIAGVLELMHGSRSLWTLVKWILGAMAATGGGVAGYFGIRKLWLP